MAGRAQSLRLWRQIEANLLGEAGRTIPRDFGQTFNDTRSYTVFIVYYEYSTVNRIYNYIDLTK